MEAGGEWRFDCIFAAFAAKIEVREAGASRRQSTGLSDLTFRISSPIKIADPPCGGRQFLAESVRFELTVRCRITGFQDRLLKPLGQLSVW